MTNVEEFVEKLLDEIHHPSEALSIAAFRFFLDEETFLTKPKTCNQNINGELTLIWQDGTISLHPLTKAVLTSDQLPFSLWKRSRFFDNHRRYFIRKENKNEYYAIHYDDAIQDTFVTQHLPDVGKKAVNRFHLKISQHQRTFAHSKGAFQQEQLTSCYLQSKSPLHPFTYQSRKLFTPEQLTYLEMENQYFQTFSIRSLPIDFQKKISPETYVLFSPCAFRRILHNGFGTHLTKYDSLSISHELLKRCSAHSSLTIHHDPLIAWSLGSLHFTNEGSPSPYVTLIQRGNPRLTPAFLPTTEAIQNHMKPCPGYQKASLHWENGSTFRYREWLKQNPEVIYIPQIEVPAVFSPTANQQAWCFQALYFAKGRPQLAGTLQLSLSLEAILCSSDLQLVSRIGWDGLGVAVPSAVLDCTS